MIKILGVEKSGTIKEIKLDEKKYDPTNNESVLKELSKKAGFKNVNDFEHSCTWELDEISVHLYGKIHGRANYENKYDFPPPVDELLFFGTCILIATDNNTKKLCDINAKEWNSIYEDLFGGFEDLVSETSSEDELENVPESMKTKDGYLKDDFVVENNILEYEKNEISSVDSDEDELDDSNFDNDDSELSEECYLYSDEDN